MTYKTTQLINPDGEPVRVSSHRVEHLLTQGYHRADALEHLDKPELWRRVKKAGLELEWTDPKEDMIEALRAAE